MGPAQAAGVLRRHRGTGDVPNWCVFKIRLKPCFTPTRPRKEMTGGTPPKTPRQGGLTPLEPRIDRTHGGQVFGDMVDTFQYVKHLA